MSNRDDIPAVISMAESFEALYRREFPTIAVLAGTVAGDRSIGEDIAQEALSRAERQWNRIHAYERPGAWVRRVAINLAISAKRRQRSERRAVRKLEPANGVAPEPRAGDPEIWQTVDRLPPRQRAVIALRYLDDRTVAEIAEILEISVSAATSNLHKARTALAEQLGGSDV